MEEPQNATRRLARARQSRGSSCRRSHGERQQATPGSRKKSQLMKKLNAWEPPAASGTVMTTVLPWNTWPDVPNEQLKLNDEEMVEQLKFSVPVLPPERNV